MNAQHPNFRLGHVHLKVTDLDRAVKFYSTVLGFKVTERVNTYCFMSYGDKHHELAIHTVPTAAAHPDPRSVGLYHFAIEVPTIRAFKEVYRKLQDAKVPTRAVDHGISKAIYFNDPDGNGVEVYIDTRIVNNRFQWCGESTPIVVPELRE